MDGRESSGLIIWAGSDTDLYFRLLSAGSPCAVVAADTPLPDLLAAREGDWRGIAVAPGMEGLRAAESSDGLARAVGFADTLAFAGNLPGAFGFLARVGGMVAAIREACGAPYLAGTARINATGPVAWAGLAALTQLRVERIESRPDALVGAVAHRLGVTVSAPRGEARVTFDGEGFAVDDIRVSGDRVELHTAAAQIRLLTSRAPDMGAMERS
ncbi:MAG: hypothetical protein ACTHW1_06335 [Ancrocorticia sp.]|uniref:hypothetical protein n=1 Tax=Ancrocorticia sp. TaxID=2593684 RepID=UPI003F938E87